ncbi:PREDICTED: aspartic proteinase CDR1-like [Tarenaya hassleriana]|uniref:aspartic proteinase CDR1-like n=1 Tax=Tarenaya hassleriana TaxID=28532 RepID=UPI00053C2045|nr:PREDICTED: aspartic proteinase CDR1-like [Tarenaya hassleriana]
MDSLFSQFLFLLLSSSLFLLNANANTERELGFTVDLIHRDSPESPFYHPVEEAPFQRVRNAILRSLNRTVHFGSVDLSKTPIQTDILSEQGEYLMKFSLGTPPLPIMAIADTGSDLIWTQCEPCMDCYPQEAPLFDPKNSSTYKNVSCESRQCKTLKRTTCSDDGRCRYSVSYGDRSRSYGNVALDTLTLGSADQRPVPLRNIAFGCGHDNSGTFNKKGSGIVGLGGGSLSLVSQIRDSIRGKFSYCLVPLSSESGRTSKMNFGSNAVVSGSGVVSTPIVKKNPETFYFLTLEAISVGDKKLRFPGSNFGTDEGNIIIDSGTTLTTLPSTFHSEIVSAVAAAVKGERVDSPIRSVLNLCYRASSDVRVPPITVHFKGADVNLKPMNYFVQVSDDVVCFAFAANDRFAIYGNLAQTNFLVGYDAVSQKVSFKNADCAKM